MNGTNLVRDLESERRGALRGGFHRLELAVSARRGSGGCGDRSDLEGAGGDGDGGGAEATRPRGRRYKEKD